MMDALNFAHEDCLVFYLCLMGYYFVVKSCKCRCVGLSIWLFGVVHRSLWISKLLCIGGMMEIYDGVFWNCWSDLVISNCLQVEGYTLIEMVGFSKWLIMMVCVWIMNVFLNGFMLNVILNGSMLHAFLNIICMWKIFAMVPFECCYWHTKKNNFPTQGCRLFFNTF